MVIIPSNIEVGPNAVAIVGWEEGSAGQVHSWLEDAAGWRIACFVNPADSPPRVDIATERPKRDARLFDFPTEDSFKGLPLLCALDWPRRLADLGIKKVLVTTGKGRERFEQMAAAREAGLELVSAIHPTAQLLPESSLGENVILHAGALVGYRAELHDGVIMNTRAQIDHHSVIRECAALDPAVVTAGNVTVERFAHIHTGAVIINRRRIGSGAIVGAGAVVIEDVPPDVTVVGVPARVIKHHRDLRNR